MSKSERALGKTVDELAAAYIHCAADTTDQFHLVGAALAGSEVKAAVFQELLDNFVRMFVSIRRPFSELASRIRTAVYRARRAGEAISAALVCGKGTEAEAARVRRADLRRDACFAHRQSLLSAFGVARRSLRDDR